jgi:RNA polymerase sigma-70 factor (ECF subfamily)
MGSAAAGDIPADPDLVRRMRLGDESALETLYTRYGGLVYSLALRIVGDPELAREVLQDTFLRSWDGRATYDAQRGRVAWWLMGIARNGAVDLLRSRPHQARLRERERLSADVPATEKNIAEVFGLRREVMNALRALPTAQRVAVELAYYGGMTQTEIARALNEPLGTVKSRMREGLDRLRDLLAPVTKRDMEANNSRD